MKEKIIYIFVFLLAFALVTEAVSYLNTHYENIFDLNFTPVKESPNDDLANTKNAGINYSDLKNFIATELKRDIIDSLKTIYKSDKEDSNKEQEKNDSVILDSLKTVKNSLKALQKKVDTEAIAKNAISAKQKQKISADSAYAVWLKKTAKIYESMDSRKAAKIIANYSDNVAKDLLYTMKKKNAAAIMSELSPELASRISREN